MKTARAIGLVLAVGVLLATSGCLTMFQQLQTADDAIAVKHGVPISLVQNARKALGVPDSRTLPGPERILPEGWMLVYDMLDASNNVVDVSGYHRSTMPRIVPHGTATPSVFDEKAATGTAAQDLDKIIGFIKDNAGKLGK